MAALEANTLEDSETEENRACNLYEEDPLVGKIQTCGRHLRQPASLGTSSLGWATRGLGRLYNALDCLSLLSAFHTQHIFFSS